MTITDADIYRLLTDAVALAGTAWAEARNVPRDPNSHSSIEERVAVMCVVRNRRAHFARYRAADDSYKAICLAPAQFSCWIAGSGTNHDALLVLMGRLVGGQPSQDPVFDETLYLATGVIGGQVLDRTGGSTSYYAPAAMQPPGHVPTWAVNQPTLLIGDQIFLKV